MKRLTAAAFGRAQRFLASEARKLERCLFEFDFGAGESSRGGVIAALEPDVRMEDSSIVATKFALQILIDVQAPAAEKLMQDGVAYVLRAFDTEKHIWTLVSNEVMQGTWILRSLTRTAMGPGRRPGRGAPPMPIAGGRRRRNGKGSSPLLCCDP
jgi:hypothetical protein